MILKEYQADCLESDFRISDPPFTLGSMSADPRYPIGLFTDPGDRSAARRHELIDQIASFPDRLRATVTGLDDQQLDTPYRDGGWTLRQVVHHVADSHLHAYARFKFAVLEDQPAVKGYAEADWANLPEAKTMPLASSLLMLTGIHARWSEFLRHLPDTAWDRTYVHSERGAETLALALELYGWHCEHHRRHIADLRAARGW